MPSRRRMREPSCGLVSYEGRVAVRTRGWVRLAVVAAVSGLTAIVLFGTAAPAPATGTPPTISFDNQPGLSSVTYGQNAAYVARITNNGVAVLRNVTFHNPIPTTIVNGQPQQAVFQSSSCGGQVTATEFVCNVVTKLDTNQTATVTISWKTPSAGSSPGCPTAASCMLTSATWGTSLRSYPMGPVATELLSGNDPSRAATYAVSACTDPSAPTLATDQNVSRATGSRRASACRACRRTAVSSRRSRRSRGRSPTRYRPRGVGDLHPGAAHRVRSGAVRLLAARDVHVRPRQRVASDPIHDVYHNGVLVSTRQRDDPHVVTSRISRTRASRPSSSSRRRTDGGTSARRRWANRRPLRRPASVRRRRPYRAPFCWASRSTSSKRRSGDGSPERR